VRSRSLLLVLAAVPAVVGACGGGADNTVDVVSTATACTPASTTLKSGKTAFKVHNQGHDVTELYVMQGSKTLGEVEDIGAGTSRTLTVNLKPAAYDLVCKPGQKGDGIKTPVTVTATGS
jgi:plastocyanin